MNTPLNIDALRQRLALRGVTPANDPAVYDHSAEVLGLTPEAVGYDRCATILNRLRQAAAAATAGDFAISVVRDQRTHARRGYAVHTRQQATADTVAAAIRGMLP